MGNYKILVYRLEEYMPMKVSPVHEQISGKNFKE